MAEGRYGVGKQPFRPDSSGTSSSIFPYISNRVVFLFLFVYSGGFTVVVHRTGVFFIVDRGRRLSVFRARFAPSCN